MHKFSCSVLTYSFWSLIWRQVFLLLSRGLQALIAAIWHTSEQFQNPEQDTSTSAASYSSVIFVSPCPRNVRVLLFVCFPELGSGAWK